MSRNPFEYLRPIDSTVFVGRWPLVRQLALDLTFEEGNSYAVIGGRRCGKSSLLNVIAYQLRQPATYEAGDYRVLPLSFDFKSAVFDSSEAFFARILAELCRRVDVAAQRHPPDAWPMRVRLDAGWFERLAKEPKLAFYNFEQAVVYVLDQLERPPMRVRLVLLLDEIDATLDHAWTKTLFNELRSLIYSSELKDRVRLVFAGSGRFLDQVKTPGSPLLNVLKLHYLAILDEAAIGQLVKHAGGLSVVAAQAIWQQSGGHPFLAQYLLHHLWEQTGGDFTKVDIEMVDYLAANFHHEQRVDLDGWAHAIEEAGLRAYAFIAMTPEWVEESQIVAAVADPALNVTRGLVALCYHGLVAHGEGWKRYRRTSNLFKKWFDDHRAFLLPDQAVQNPLEKTLGETGASIHINTGGGAYIGGNVHTGDGKFVGHNDVVRGNQVSGDKISEDDKSKS